MQDFGVEKCLNRTHREQQSNVYHRVSKYINDIIFCLFCRTRSGVPVVHVDWENGTFGAFGRRVCGRDSHGRRCVRVSCCPGPRRLLPERRFSTAAWMHFSRAVQGQADLQIQWVPACYDYNLTARYRVYSLCCLLRL